MMVRQLDIHMQKMNLDSHTTPHTELKVNEVLNIGVKTIKLLGENKGVTLHDLGLSDDFFNMTLKVQIIKEI